MKIAVLMSTYNGEKYLREQIDSILAQEGNFELDLWVRDDGSTDRTKRILQEYESNGKLKWYSGENLGPAKSFINLVKHCLNYDYYSFADQDDYWAPDKIQSAIDSVSSKKGKQIYFTDAAIVDSRLNAMGRTIYRSFPCTDFETVSCAGGILGCTMVFNSELAKAVQVKPIPDCMVMHDYYLAELCLALSGEIEFNPQVSIKYRQHDDNVIGAPRGKQSTIKNRVREIVKKYRVSISSQAAEILVLYKDEVPRDKAEWLKKVANYKKNLMNRIGLATTKKTRYANKNAAVTIRLSLLLGNR